MTEIATKGLESNTGEVEILEFAVGSQTFGVNILKIEAIEQYDPGRVTPIPMAPPAVTGTLLFRQRTIPLIDLATELGVRSESVQEQGKDKDVGRIVLVTEFNNTTVGFVADSVNRIHRISWENISPIDHVFDSASAEFTGSFNIEGREILVLDVEKIVSEFIPGSSSDVTAETNLDHAQAHLRPKVRILVADDSGTIRSLITDTLTRGNYTNVSTFNNGRDAYDAIEKLKAEAEEKGQNLADWPTLLITDIEMPRMDGLSLCKAIKQNLGLDRMGVILFSTQVNDEVATYAKKVQADGCISKPQISQLVRMIDELTLEKVQD